MSDQSDTVQRPPSEGWYALGGNPNDLAYFDGQVWTWRGSRDPSGEWRQEPIVPPSPTTPGPLEAQASDTPRAGPPSGGPPYTPGPYSGVTGSPAVPGAPGYPGLPRYPGGPPYGPYQPGPWGSPAPPPRRPGLLDLHGTEPQRQARWKTLLRALLVIPNLIVLFFLLVAVFFLTIAMWFAALFTARVPESWWRFSVDVLEWQARTYSYSYFLTDRYPPFKLGDAAYPVWMTLDGPPDRFNRFSIFFRAILMVPAWVVVNVFSYGVGIFSIVTWLATLVAGRCPKSLHLMNSAWLRYSLRVNAFQLLLTTTYPNRPLGDQWSAYGPASLERGEIVLTGASKGLAIVAIVIGAVAYVVSPAVSATVGPTPVGSQRAVTQFDAMQSRSISAATNYREKAVSCSTWKCLRAATPILLHSLDTQISSLQGITFPTSKTQSEADALITALRGERSVVTQMAHASSKDVLQSDVNRLATLTGQLQPLARTLVADLNAVR